MLRAAIAFAVLGSTTQISAQVVQLPSRHTFSIQTSVLVPDSGSAYLGAVGRSRHHRSSHGWSPLGRTSRTGALIGTGVSVHATIIDHTELDALVLEEARAIREATGEKQPAPNASHVTSPTMKSPVASVAEIKRSLAADDAAQEAAAAANFHTATEYERRGDHALARSYYRVAARKSTGPIRERALERLARMPQAKKSR